MDAEEKKFGKGERLEPKLTLRAGPIKRTIAAAMIGLGGAFTSTEASTFKAPATFGSVAGTKEDTPPTESGALRAWMQKIFEISPTFGSDDVQYFNSDHGPDRVFFKADLPDGGSVLVECTSAACVGAVLPIDFSQIYGDEAALLKDVLKTLESKKPLPLKTIEPSDDGSPAERETWLSGTIRFGDHWIFLLVNPRGGVLSREYQLVRPDSR